MKPRKFDKDANHILREIKRLEAHGLAIDRDSLIEYFQLTGLSRYEVLREILLKEVKDRESNNDFLITAYYLLYSRGKKNNDPDWFDYFRKHEFYSALGKTRIALEGSKLIIDCGRSCGSCDHLVKRYIDFDIKLEAFPYPVKECKDELCSAFSITASPRFIERNGYLPLYPVKGISKPPEPIKKKTIVSILGDWFNRS